MLKENRLEKLVYPVKRSAWLHASPLRNFARRHFFDVHGIISFKQSISITEVQNPLYRIFILPTRRL